MEEPKIKLLLVEDNPGDARLIQEMVKKAGVGRYEISTVGTLDNAVDQLRKSSFDGLILDLNLPDSQGITTLKSILGNAPGTAVVVITGLDDEALVVDSLHTGAEDYLVKGKFDGSLLIRSLRYAIERKRSERELRESKSLFASVVENIPLMIFLKESKDLRFVIFNRAGEELLGYDRKDLLGRNNLDLFPPEQAANFMSKDREVLDGEAGMLDIPEEFILTAKKGQRILHTRKVCIRGEDGVTKYLLGISEDITERKQEELKLLRALDEAQRFREIMDQIPVYVYFKDAQSRYVYGNKATLELFRCSLEGLIGRQDSELMPTGAAEQIKAIEARVLQGEQTTEEVVSENGRVFWEVKTPIWEGAEHKKIIGLLAVSRDITESRKAEEKDRLLATIVESSDNAIFSRDLANLITSWNRGAEKIYGYSPAEAIGMSAEQLVPAERKEEMRMLTEQLNAGHKIAHFETEHLRKNGETIQVALTITPLQGQNGQAIGFSTIASNVTEFKLLKQGLMQAQKLASIGEMAGGIAHDFNNLLNVIIGYSDLALIKKDDRDAVQSYLEEVKGAGKKAAALTGQLLAFSRKQNLSPKSLSLNLVVQDMEKMLKEAVGEKVTLKLELDKGLQAIYADQTQMEQVLMNLCVNARDAITQGGQLLIQTCNCTLSESQALEISEARVGEFVCLTVKDNGKGMEPITMAKIFEPFFTTKTRGKGTGLGLSVTYGIVKQHNGWINVSSQPGQGTEFKVWLPMDTRKSEEPRESKKIALEYGRGTGERILLVEDQPENLALSTVILQKHGYIVFPAQNAEEALISFKEEKKKFNLLFTDMILPGMDGRQLAEEVSRQNPGIKVLVCSGYLDDRIELPELDKLGYRFLGKPYESETMLAAVHKALYA